MKTCSRCKLDKELTNFAINKNKKCGLQSYCKLCQKEIRENKIYETNNSDYHKKYYTANKDVLLEKQKEYKGKNIDAYREYQKEYRSDRRKYDINFKLNGLIRYNVKRIYNLMNTAKDEKTYSIVDYTPKELKHHIESLFTEGMSWENYGVVWEIDHKKPIKWFTDNKNLFNTAKELCIEANKLDNLQPLFKSINRQKGGTY